ncbi:MAG: site-specific integrase [Chloroflexi bacterium]|nr:site-specific integrase [Chloroflexota bacterium]
MEKIIDRFLTELKNDGYSDNTISAYGSDIRQFCAYLQEVDPSVQHWQEVIRTRRFVPSIRRDRRTPRTTQSTSQPIN